MMMMMMMMIMMMIMMMMMMMIKMIIMRMRMRIKIACVAGGILSHVARARPTRGNGGGAANSRGKAARSERRSREIPPAGKLGFFECRPLLAAR